ncbi:MAG: hypothetical protein IKD31_04070 [Clostridia bacterium]|nr:hypothetical protein [Clostridia bacterium]
MEDTLFPQNASKSASEWIKAEEMRYHGAVSRIASRILSQKIRFVFLAGPSCSGKTTTGHRLVKCLSEGGKRVFTFSTDDFFFNEEVAPRNDDGTPRYDAFSHTDSAYIISVLRCFSQGKDTELPSFDFYRGRRCEKTTPVSPADYDVFILEGIHALNNVILEALPPSEKRVCIYLELLRGVRTESGSESLSADEIRFCRRLIRDYKHRNASADRTYSLWGNVLRDEKEILHPFRNNADFTVETGLGYEVAALRDQVIGVLQKASPEGPNRQRADDLIRSVSAFPSFPSRWVPQNSVLREFID